MADPGCVRGPVPTALATAAAVRSGSQSARESVEHVLGRIAAYEDRVHAFTVVRAERALAEAEALDAGGPGHDGPLAGVPVAVKEEYDVTGEVTTLGGYGNSTPAGADSEAIRRLREAGAIIVGKTVMPEFGEFPHGTSARHGATHNPWAPSRSPGGSSAGSAAAVAAGMVAIGMGGDGGGSLRIPAANCGLVGLKPQRGRISPAPLTRHWFGLVSLGAITRTVADSALVLDVVAGNLPTDDWRVAPPRRPFSQAVQEALEHGLGPLRIGWSSAPVLPGTAVDPQVATAIETVATALSGLGHDVRPLARRWPAATFPFLAQFFAGIREEAGQVEHPHQLEANTRATVRLSRWADDRVVKSALAEMDRVTRRVDRLLGSHDVLLLPTTVGLPAPVDLFAGLGLAQAMSRSSPIVGNAALFNVSGHPALSVPAGLSAQGWPIGAQLAGPTGREDLLLALGAQLEQALCWPGIAPDYR